MIALKAFRERKGLSQSDVANVLGVSRSTVAMWETSGSCPRSKNLTQLADMFGCTIDELYGRAPPAENRDSA